MAELDGPRLEPRSGQTKRLVVFAHGYGADGNDLIDIGRAWQQLLPQAAFVSPHAPEPCGQAPVGRQWFALTFRNPDERWIGVNKAAPLVERFLDAELARHKLPPSALALVGFSQGTMMALHVGLRRAAAPAAIVGYSGVLVVPPDASVDRADMRIDSAVDKSDGAAPVDGPGEMMCYAPVSGCSPDAGGGKCDPTCQTGCGCREKCSITTAGAFSRIRSTGSRLIPPASSFATSGRL